MEKPEWTFCPTQYIPHLPFFAREIWFFKMYFYWNIAALQCCVSVYRTVPWLSCMYRYIPRFWISSAHISLQSAEESFLCCTVFSHYYLLLYCVFFIHSATGECFRYFQVLAVVNSVAMNTGVCVSFRISFLQIYKLYRESFLHSWEWDCWIIWHHKFYYTM